MGISGLLPFLQAASRKCYINEFRGCSVAIDSYCWLHKGAFACAEKLVRGEDTNMYITYCMKYLQLLQSYDITPIMVFDGQHLPAKKQTETKRREQRKFARARGVELLRLGKTEEARQYFRQCVDITHTMALALIKECRKRNIDCIVAPYEADAQLAFLNMRGIADIIITEDSDLILFGCTKILFKFSLDGSGMLVEQEKLNDAMKMRPDEFTFDKFRYMCIMSGCDYLESLPGIGLKRAHKAIKMTADPDIYKLLLRLPRYLNLRNVKVSQEYIEKFKLADATIKHQVVYDPIHRMLLHLTDPDEHGTSSEYLKNAGKFCDNEKAFQMALGNIDPITLKVMDDWNPDVSQRKELWGTHSRNSIWSKNYKKSENSDKSSKIPNLEVRCTKNKKITVASSEQITTIQEQQMLEYDKKLLEELKMYQNVEPPPKRLKVDSNKADINESNPNIISDTQLVNPFIKHKQPNKFSKFNVTEIDHDKCIQSRFFTSKPKISTDADVSNVEESLRCHVDMPTIDCINNETKDIQQNEDNETSQTSQDSCEEENCSVKAEHNVCKCKTDNNDRTSPVLSFSAFSKNSPLGSFKYNKSVKKYSRKKIMLNVEKSQVRINTVFKPPSIEDLNDKVDDTEVRGSGTVDSDKENLTPEEKEEPHAEIVVTETIEEEVSSEELTVEDVAFQEGIINSEINPISENVEIDKTLTAEDINHVQNILTNSVCEDSIDKLTPEGDVSVSNNALQRESNYANSTRSSDSAVINQDLRLKPSHERTSRFFHSKHQKKKKEDAKQLTIVGMFNRMKSNN